MSSIPTPSDPKPASFHATGAAMQILGIVIFLIGLALLGYVFATANRMLNLPAPDLSAPVNGQTPQAMQVGQGFLGFVRQLLLLLLMCITGGVIASVGTNLFFKARR